MQIAYNMPIMRPDLVEQGLWDKSSLMTADNALRILNRVNDSLCICLLRAIDAVKELGQRKFVCGSSITLADIQIYQDVGQCQVPNHRFFV